MISLDEIMKKFIALPMGILDLAICYLFMFCVQSTHAFQTHFHLTQSYGLYRCTVVEMMNKARCQSVSEQHTNVV